MPSYAIAHLACTALSFLAPPALPQEVTTSAARPLDAHEFATLRAGAPAASLSIDLPRHGCVQVDFVRAQLVSSDFTVDLARVVKNRVVSTSMPNALTSALPYAYTGTIAGMEDARVYVGFGSGAAAGLVAGVIEIGEESWWLSSGSDAARRAGFPAMIAHESALAGQPLDGMMCGAMDLKENAEAWNAGSNGGGEGGVAGGAGCREFRIAVETDTEFTMSAFGGNTVAAAQYAILLLGATSQVYARDMNARIPISYLRLWTGDDPWIQTEMGAQLTEYQGYWNANMGSVQRDLGHYLAGRGLGGGVAWLSVVCSNQQYGYGLSSGIGYGFPYPLIDHDNGNWEPMVVSHEIGHNFGAPHTHDHTPPADGCGLNDCTLASTGTIMSYCHGCPGGMANISLLFHPFSLNSIAGHLAGVSCNNQGAFAVDDAASTLEGGTVDIAPFTNDAFVNCSTLTLQSFDSTSGAGGTVTLLAGEPPVLRYTAPSAFSGVDSFNYKAMDPSGVVSTARIYVTVAPIYDQTYLTATAPGVPASWYALAGDTANLPDFTTLTSYGGSVLANIDIPSTGDLFSTTGRTDSVAAVFEGYISIPTTGLWTFSTESDDGSRLLVDSQLVVTNDGLHGMVDRSGQIALEAGFHRYRVEFFENFGGAGEIVRWQGPSTARAVIPAAAFIKNGLVMQLDLNGDGTVGAIDLATILGSWGPVPVNTPADFDRNGSVGASDLAVLLSNWGS